MNAQELRDRIVSLGPWHHDVEVAPGVRTGEPAPPGTYPSELGTPTMIQPERSMEWLFKEVYPDGLAGRSVLDCACNAGGYLFAARRLGAGRSFGFDVRDHWINQARFLAEHLPSDNIEFATLDLASLPERHLEPFDITIFNGIFYHLPDPIAGLRIAADHTRELLVVNTATLPGTGDALVLNRESATEVMSGVHSLAWLPTNDRVLRAILEWCGFPYTRLRFERRTEVENWRRIEVIAARDESTFAHYDAGRARHEPARNPGWVRRLLGRA
jgi:SAM-dependent methyltransferase